MDLAARRRAAEAELERIELEERAAQEQASQPAESAPVDDETAMYALAARINAAPLDAYGARTGLSRRDVNEYVSRRWRSHLRQHGMFGVR